MARSALRGFLALAVLTAGLAVSIPPVPVAASGASEATTVRLDGMADRVAAGGSHTCVILDSGGVACWGNGTSGRLGYGNANSIGDNENPAGNPVNGGVVSLPGGRNATAVAAGDSHTCALLANGSVTCWGAGTSGRLGYGNTNNIGDNETPAGNPVNAGVVSLPGGQRAVAISAGAAHTCALLANGTVTCWGDGLNGQLGYGNTNNIGDNETPAGNPANGGIVSLPGGQTAVAITAGDFHTCAVLANGSVTCWGFNGNGQLGYGNTNNIGGTVTPAGNPVNGGIVSLPGGQTAIAIAAGSYHTCAVLANGSVTCWGTGSSGRLGYGNTNNIGDNETPAANPVNAGVVGLPGGQSAVAISAGVAHTCALLANGGVTCWGDGLNGQLGYGNGNNIGDNETPAGNPVNGGIIVLPSGQNAAAMSVGSYHACAVLLDGTVTCWGRGLEGQLGYGNSDIIGDNETLAANPVNGGVVQLPGSQTAVAITAGLFHTCALLANGTVSCWGVGGNGRLGYGNTNNIGDNETPAANPSSGGVVALPGGQTATALAAGSYHTCALLANGAITCWGYNTVGQLGYGNLNDIGDGETPATNPVNGGIVPLPNGLTATAMSAGLTHTCALLSNGSVSCWGAGFFGQLGYGNTNNIGDTETPAANPVNGGVVALPGGQTATAIAAAGYHTCALLASGSVSCWGEASSGQLGFGNTNDIGDNETPATNPVGGGIVVLPGGQSATALVAGGSHMCALLASGSVSCWGEGSSGQLGFGNSNIIGDNETPAANPVGGGIVALPAGQTATALSAGDQHTCGLLANGASTCWGAGGAGRLGYGNTNAIGDNETPAGNPVNGGIIALPGGQTATAITAGGSHSCALLANSTVTCWGTGGGGRLGYGNTNDIGDNETPVANPTSGGVVALANHLSVIDYRALTPARLLDTRGTGATIDDQFEAGGVRAAGSTLQLAVAGRGGVPADAASITLSVAAVSPAAGGYLTIWPCASAQPNASSLNYSAGVTTANTVITGIRGGVCIFTSQATQLIADVVGFTPRSSTLTSLTPARYLDTRPGGSTFDDLLEGSGQRPAGSTATVSIANRGNVPSGTRTVILNVAALAPVAGGFLTIWPCDETRPNASNLNYSTGVNTANLVITRAAANGMVCIYTSQATQLIADVVGYYSHNTAPGPSLMRTVNPGRLVDTRASGATTDSRYENTGLLVANATNTYQITNRFPLANANVAVLNITVVTPGANGFVTVWPCDQAKPNASSLNFVAGVNRAVQVLTKLSPSGTVCVSSSQATHLIIDANGTTM